MGSCFTRCRVVSLLAFFPRLYSSSDVYCLAAFGLTGINCLARIAIGLKGWAWDGAEGYRIPAGKGESWLDTVWSHRCLDIQSGSGPGFRQSPLASGVLYEFIYKPHAIYLFDHNLACLTCDRCCALTCSDE